MTFSIGARSFRAFTWGMLCAATLWSASGAAAEVQTRAVTIQQEKKRIESTVQALGGWKAWDDSLAPWRKAILELPIVGRGRRGTDGMLFSGATTDFLQRRFGPVEAPNEILPPWETAAVTAARDLKELLAKRGVDLIVAPVPCTLSIYPERGGIPSPKEVGIQYLRLIYELLVNDVDVIDLYTPFRERRYKNDELLYYPTDHHWTGRGIVVGASLIAERLARYVPLAEAKAQQPRYRREPVTIRQWEGGLAQGADPEQYPLEDIERFQVSSVDGGLYAEPEQAPVVIVGDSFALYQRFAGTATDLGPNLAYELNCPVQTLTSDRIMAHQVSRRLARQGADFLQGRIVVVWVAMDISFDKGQLGGDSFIPRNAGYGLKKALE